MGSFPPNGFGLYDMVWNVWEWTSTVFRGYPYRGYAAREDPESRERRVLRGGSWGRAAGDARASDRFGLDPGFGLSFIGFRCAKTP